MAFSDVLETLLIWRGDPLQIAVFSAFFFVLSWLMSKLCCPRRHSDSIKLRDPRHGHRWYSVEFLHQPTYCSVCEQAAVSGHCCESCGLCICSVHKCEDQADKEFACKVLALSRRDSMKHHWQHGNLPLCSTCFVCGDQCGTEPRLSDLRCVWCHRTAHDNCLGARATIECDLGKHRNLIIPPYAVALKLIGWRSQKRIAISELTAPPSIDNWSPLLVLANPKSGGNDAHVLMKNFRRLLNPAQVFDLSQDSPQSVLDLCRLLPDQKWRVLVCGGDGTVGWVLSSLDKLALENPPDIAICPLGTGNDLARVLNWGSGYTLGEPAEDILHDVQCAKSTPVDRWKVSIMRPGYLHLRRPLKTLHMNNYCGIGCDAVVTLNFHKTRESRPGLFTNRLFNKAWYLGYGAKDVLEAVCRNLHQKIELEMDGVRQDLPELEGIVVLNINSWCGGCPIWSTERLGSRSNSSADLAAEAASSQLRGRHDSSSSSEGDSRQAVTYGPSRFDDGVLEVLGLYSSLHIARLQVSLADPLRIGQARSVKITVKSKTPLPVQVDGEPWEQGQSVISITAANQAPMLSRLHTSS